MKVSMSAVWDRTTAFLSAYGGPLFGIAALTLFLPTFISETLAPFGERAMSWKLGLGLLSLAFGILSLWGQLAITALAIDPPAGPATARRVATARLPKMILVSIVLLLILALFAVPVLAILLGSGVPLEQLGGPNPAAAIGPGAAGAIGLYVLLIALPLFLFLAARLMVVTTSVVVAENRGLGAIGRSFDLTRGITWRIIGVLLLYLIVMAVVSLAAQSVLGSVFRLVFRGDGPVTVASVLTALVTAAVGAVFSVIAAAFTAHLYLAARERQAALAGAGAVTDAPLHL